MTLTDGEVNALVDSMLRAPSVSPQGWNEMMGTVLGKSFYFLIVQDERLELWRINRMSSYGMDGSGGIRWFDVTFDTAETWTYPKHEFDSALFRWNKSINSGWETKWEHGEWQGGNSVGLLITEKGRVSEIRGVALLNKVI